MIETGFKLAWLVLAIVVVTRSGWLARQRLSTSVLHGAIWVVVLAIVAVVAQWDNWRLK